MSQRGRVTHVQFTELPVDDQDRAITFYTEILGFRVGRDMPYQEGWRWVELEIPDARTRILFVHRPPAAPEASAARGPALALIVDDIDAFHAAASAAGATFTQEPEPAPWSRERRYALLRDSEGNTVMVQTG